MNKHELLPAQVKETSIAPLGDKLRKRLEQSLSDNTKTAYAEDWKIFMQWCLEAQLSPLPATPETIALFIDAQASSFVVRQTKPRTRPSKANRNPTRLKLKAENL